MLNPLDAPDAVSGAAEPLEELLDDCNWGVSSIVLFHVVPVAGVTPGHDWLKDLVQAVCHPEAGGHQVGTSVVPFESPGAWRDIFRRQVIDGFMHSAQRSSDPNARTPAEIRGAGELADGVADLIEAHLGPVRSAGDVSGPYLGDDIWCRNLLLVTDNWATVLHLGFSD
ncbi:hypothetical protein ACIRST_32075 [Kitasatospora sp. NPDC101447]|uniref:hypothetical protein n=1 Tax=Kitasatospora sp. NPDC101447 TaxID=3364102 RepID=UPI00381F5070